LAVRQRGRRNGRPAHGDALSSSRARISANPSRFRPCPQVGITGPFVVGGEADAPGRGRPGSPPRAPGLAVPSRKAPNSGCWPNFATLAANHDVEPGRGPRCPRRSRAHLASQRLGLLRVTGREDAPSGHEVVEQQRLAPHHVVLRGREPLTVHCERSRPPLAQAGRGDPAVGARPVTPEEQVLHPDARTPRATPRSSHRRDRTAASLNLDSAAPQP
jgi:hypothetical protein